MTEGQKVTLIMRGFSSTWSYNNRLARRQWRRSKCSLLHLTSKSKCARNRAARNYIRIFPSMFAGKNRLWAFFRPFFTEQITSGPHSSIFWKSSSFHSGLVFHFTWFRFLNQGFPRSQSAQIQMHKFCKKWSSAKSPESLFSAFLCPLFNSSSLRPPDWCRPRWPRAPCRPTRWGNWRMANRPRSSWCCSRRLPAFKRYLPFWRISAGGRREAQKVFQNGALYL